MYFLTNCVMFSLEIQKTLIVWCRKCTHVNTKVHKKSKRLHAQSTKNITYTLDRLA